MHQVHPCLNLYKTHLAAHETMPSSYQRHGEAAGYFLGGQRLLSMAVAVQILLSRAKEDYPRDRPPPLRFIRSCSSSLAAPTLHKLEATFKVPVLEVGAEGASEARSHFHGLAGSLLCTLCRTCPAHTTVSMQAYAMTEASHQMTSNPLPKHGPHKPGWAPAPPIKKASCALQLILASCISRESCREQCNVNVLL